MIDLTLLGLAFVSASALRDRWHQAEVREQAMLRRMIPALPPPAILPLPGVAPSTASAYLEVAQQFLFSRDRNPTVILDPPPPPPPPKPMPSLPVLHGLIDLGGGPTVILSERAGAPHKSYRVGETIGEFKLTGLTHQEIVFEWDGKEVKRRLEELVDRRPQAEAPAETAAAPAPKPATTGLTSLENKAGPGVELGATSRACVPGDTTPAGTVQDGYRKVVAKTPFGDSCRWEAVK